MQNGKDNGIDFSYRDPISFVLYVSDLFKVGSDGVNKMMMMSQHEVEMNVPRFINYKDTSKSTFLLAAKST